MTKHIGIEILWWYLVGNDDDDDELFLWNGWSRKGPYFQPGPLSKILTIANLWHATSSIWTCREPGFMLCWMKLCSFVNHYTTTPRGVKVLRHLHTTWYVGALKFNPSNHFFTNNCPWDQEIWVYVKQDQALHMEKICFFCFCWQPFYWWWK